MSGEQLVHRDDDLGRLAGDPLEGGRSRRPRHLQRRGIRATSSALAAQASKAVSQGAQYVTIEMGANDACTSTGATMTPIATFQANVAAVLKTLSTSAAKPQIFVASIPSIMRLYQLEVGNGSARFMWSLLGICPSMLANPTSTKPADVQRRAAVQAQVDAYNAALSAACATTVNRECSP